MNTSEHNTATRKSPGIKVAAHAPDYVMWWRYTMLIGLYFGAPYLDAANYAGIQRLLVALLGFMTIAGTVYMAVQPLLRRRHARRPAPASPMLELSWKEHLICTAAFLLLLVHFNFA